MAASSLSAFHTTTLASRPDNRRPNPFSPFLSQGSFRPHNLKNPWLGITITKLSLHSSNLQSGIPKYQSIIATVLFSLPTAKAETPSSTEEIPKWSSKAIKSFAMSELEARKLKYPTTGTEALLMGILIEGTSFAAKFLRENGITLLKVREETVKLLGKADIYFFSREHPPLTEDAQKALDWALEEKLRSGQNGEITTTHLLLGVWSEEESPGYKILSSLGFSNEKAKQLEALISEPGFVDD